LNAPPKTVPLVPLSDLVDLARSVAATVKIARSFIVSIEYALPRDKSYREVGDALDRLEREAAAAIARERVPLPGLEDPG